MAITKMKKLRLMAVKSQEKELLRELLLLGCVEVNSPEKALSDEELAALVTTDSGDLADLRLEYADLQGGLDELDRYAPAKKKMLQAKPEIADVDLLDEKDVADAMDIARKVSYFDDQIRRITVEISRQKSIIESLTPWRELELPLNYTGTDTCDVLFGSVPAVTDGKAMKAALEDAAPAAELLCVHEDEEQKCYILIVYKAERDAALAAVREFGFSIVGFPVEGGTAASGIAKAQASISELEMGRDTLTQMIVDEAPNRDKLKQATDTFSTKVERAVAAEKLLRTETTVTLEGWMPAEKESELAAVLEKYDCAWETAEPLPEEYPEVPVKLKNNFLTRSLNMVTEMYSLPAYDGVDPNPLMAPFFIFFYGFMMADMGYGLVMMLASLIILKKAKPDGATMRYMVPLLGWCGLSTFIMGAVTGGFFGDLIPQLAQMINPNTTFTQMPRLFSPLDDALAVLIGSLALGVVQIFTGMIVNMYRQFKRGEAMAALCGEGAWFLIFISLGVGFALGYAKYGLIAALVIIVLTQGYGKKGIGGKLMGIGGSLYNNITGYFSDILSYSRLMALMLAGAVIAQVFNTLGAITGNIVFFFIISMIGNALNFALNLLGCYVHDMRLQCLEFFSRFYSDGGKPFRPLDFNTKYVHVVKK